MRADDRPVNRRRIFPLFLITRSHMDQTSTGLIALLKSPGPQPEAWNRFVSFYAGEVLRWARGQGFQEADAEDAAQTVLANIRELLKGYQRVPGKSFGGWLFRVTANECRARRRRFPRGSSPRGSPRWHG